MIKHRTGGYSRAAIILRRHIGSDLLEIRDGMTPLKYYYSATVSKVPHHRTACGNMYK